MKHFVMCKGLPASGKSTWATEYIKGKKNWIRINNDSLQLMMFGEAFAAGRNKELTAAREAMIDHCMAQGQNIIVDNTNLSPKNEENYRNKIALFNKANKEGYDFEVRDFTHVPLVECLKRNKQRASAVPEDVILVMYNQFILKEQVTVVKPSHISGLPSGIIVDIDGTVAQLVNRGPYEYDKVYSDEPIQHVCHLVETYANLGHEILFISGRDERCRADTLRWLKDKTKLPTKHLYLNKAGETRSSAITKKEIYHAHVHGKVNVLFALEDRWKNIVSWNELNIPTLMVGIDCFF